MKYDVFISYSRKDIEIAKSLCAVLDAYKQHYKFEYFFDTSEIRGRDEYLKRISLAISESKTLLFLASQNSYNSEFCAKELLFADKRGVHIHQYRIDDADMPLELDMLLGTHQYREMKSTSIELIVREVLADSLGYEILPLEELNSENKKQQGVSQNQDNGETDDVIDLALKKIGNWLKRHIESVAFIFLMILFASGTLIAYHFWSPKEQIPEAIVEVKTYRVGDYYDDGSKQGVVFEVTGDGLHGKIVSLDQTKDLWCTEEQYEKEIIVGTPSYSDGKANTNRVMARADSANYTAVKWCRTKGQEWYLPSIEELELLYQVKDEVNKTLQYQSADVLQDEYYWSSTEKNEFWAWRVGMSDGRTYLDLKWYYNSVRAVAAF